MKLHNRFTLSILIVCTFLLVACGTSPPVDQPSAVTVEEAEEAVAVEEVEVAEAVTVEEAEEVVAAEEAIVLRISLAEYPDALPQREAYLAEMQERLSAELSEENGLNIELDFETRTVRGSLAANCDGQSLTGLSNFDLYQLDSPTALHGFEEHEMVPLPETIRTGVNPFEPGVRAFTNTDGQLLGLAQATSPFVVIYNPEIVGELSEKISLDEMIGLVDAFGLAMPPDPGIMLASAQSTLGDDFNEDFLFQGEYLAVVEEYAPLVDELAGQENVFAADIDTLVKVFINQEVPLLIHNTGFLTKLTEAGYDGAVATTSYPYFEYPGGSAHATGWVVPAASSQQKLAWSLAEKLTRDPAMIQWALANGMVPMNDVGFEVLMVDQERSDGLLPQGLIATSGLNPLRNSAAESTAWRIPAYIDLDLYNEILLPASVKIMDAIINDKISLLEAVERLEEVREQLGLN